MFTRDIKDEVTRVMRENGKNVYKVTVVPILVIIAMDYIVPSSITMSTIFSLVLSVLVAILGVLISNMILSIYRGETPNINSHVKEELKDGKMIALAVNRTIFIMLWSLLFVIPGMIKQLSYAFSPYILKDDRTLSANDAITKSKTMTYGKKWELAKLNLYYYWPPVLIEIISGVIAFAVFYMSFFSSISLTPPIATLMVGLVIVSLLSKGISLLLVLYALPRYELAIAIMYEDSKE